MANALTELQDTLKNCNQTVDTIAYALINVQRSYDHTETLLDTRVSKDLTPLNIEYDDGYGGQELYGTIVFNDGTWLERGEYDGSEWWAYKNTPTPDTVFNDQP